MTFIIKDSVIIAQGIYSATSHLILRLEVMDECSENDIKHEFVLVVRMW